MDQAVSAVLKDGMSVNKASKIFNVPRKILTERVGGRVRAVEKYTVKHHYSKLPGTVHLFSIILNVIC